MDSYEFRSYVNKGLFEQFCESTLKNHLLKGGIRWSYKSRCKDKQYPFDAEFHGKVSGHRGKILFEFKGPEAGTSDSRARTAIKSDLCGSRNSPGKLQRAAAIRNKAVLYVLIMSVPATERFENDIKGYIKRQRLPFHFECWSFSSVSGWLEEFLDLHTFLRRPDQDRNLDTFIQKLIEQLAPVDFLQYRRLDSVYVFPREYKKILRVLREKNIVFIIGPPHVGKTFTATYLLWHFYKIGGCEPRWVEPKPLEREPFPDQRLQSIAKETSLVRLVKDNVGPDKVTYVEDVFGRTSEEESRDARRKPEELLIHLVDFALETPGARVIITSREKIFNKALRMAPQLEKLVVRLKGSVKLQLSSYSRNDRLKLMERYARLHSCEWIEKSSGKLPVDVIEAAEKLGTPQAIWLYCRLSHSSGTSKQRLKSFQKASQELTKAFANDILCLEETALGLLLTAEYCKSNVFEAAFPRFISGEDPLLKWKQAAEILADRAKLSRGLRYLAYIHPSYKEALDLALSMDPVRHLFAEMVKTLGQDARWKMRVHAVNVLGRKYAQLDREGSELLRALCKDPVQEVRGVAAQALGRNYGQLEREDRELLRAFYKDPAQKVRTSAAYVLGGNYAQLDWDGRESLRALCKDAELRWSAAWALGANYEQLDPEGRELLRALCRDPDGDVRRAAAQGLGDNCEQLDPEGRELLRALCRDPDEDVRRAAAIVLGDNYAQLDLEGRELLRALCKDLDEEVRIFAAQGLSDNYSRLDHEDRELLRALCKDPEVRWSAAKALGANYARLDHEDRELLRALCKDPDKEVRGNAAKGLGYNYAQLDPEDRDLLKDLCKDPDKVVSGSAIKALGKNYGHLYEKG
jgi:HEAT repeat protein